MSDQIKARLDAILESLEGWVHAAGCPAVVYAVPSSAVESGTQVNVLLLDVVNAPTPAGRSMERTPPFQIVLRYLVSVTSADPIEAQRLLCSLLFRATEHSEFEAELAVIPFELWRSFNVPPRPSFVLRVPLRLARDSDATPRVRQPPEVRHLKLRPLRGIVMGPGNLPVGDARVELPSARLATQTDPRGRFFFAGVPAEPATAAFRVRARSAELVADFELPKGEEDALIIQFKPLEV
jgi:hypothetical protein